MTSDITCGLRYAAACLEKLADHADDRRQERTDLTPAEVAALKARVRKLQPLLLPDATYHHGWSGRGYAVVGPVGRKRKKHVVKTILSPTMTPPGSPLPSIPPPPGEGAQAEGPTGTAAPEHPGWASPPRRRLLLPRA